MLAQVVNKNQVVKDTTTIHLFVDNIKKLPKNRVRLEKYHNGVWYSFVVHTAALKSDVDAVAIYRGTGSLTLSKNVAMILLGLDEAKIAHKNVIKVTKHGPFTSLFDAPRSCILKMVTHVN